MVILRGWETIRCNSVECETQRKMWNAEKNGDCSVCVTLQLKCAKNKESETCIGSTLYMKTI